MSRAAVVTLLVDVQCYSCAVWYAIPETLDEAAHAKRGPDGRRIWCPNGHSWWYIGETDAERERRLRRHAEDAAASARARADQAEASLRTTKGHVTRLRKRVTAGVCPFGCHRHFVNLERHIAAKHAGQPLDGET